MLVSLYQKSMISFFALICMSCNNFYVGNIFSWARNDDNISVQMAIASGDDELIELAYNEQVDVLSNTSSGENFTLYISTLLNIANLQAVRSQGASLLFALVDFDVDLGDITDYLSSDVVVDQMWDLTLRVLEVYELGGDANDTQDVLAILGFAIKWNANADELPFTFVEFLEAYPDGTFDSGVDWTGTSWSDSTEFQAEFTEDRDKIVSTLVSKGAETEDGQKVKDRLALLLYL